LGNSVSSPTYAALSHLSSSAPNGFTNLIFKSNSNTGTTIISGSGNIFSNPAAPVTGYIRYVGTNNNLYLNNSNGVNSQITASATTVSGATPTMNNNIFNGTGNFSINQATNPGTHTYSQNIFNSNGTTTINALGFTGSLNILANVSSNGTITINAASASVAQIATGISGSGTVSVNSNFLLAGTITNTSPRILLTTNTQSISQNLIAGSSITVTNISASANVNMLSNITNGAMSYTNASATGVHTSVGGVSNSQGAITVNAIGSAVSMTNGIFIGGPTITNNSFSGSAGGGTLNANRNLFQGQQHTLSVTGSQELTTGPNFSDNAILGRAITIFSNLTGTGNYRDLNGCVIGGQNLIVSASNSFGLTEGGSGHFGRYNANDGIRNKTGENVFSVGTGNATTRKTGFLIDSGSNSYFEGSLSVSGSTSLTGSLTLNGNTITAVNTGSFAITGSNSFNGSQTITGSLIVSGSGAEVRIPSFDATQGRIKETLSFTGSRFASPLSTTVEMENLNATEFGFNQLDSADNLTGAQFILNTNKASTFTELKLNARYTGSSDANIVIRNAAGVRTFTVNADVTSLGGSLSVSGSSSLTGSLVVSSFTTLASVSSSLNFADDTAAAAGGVPLGGLYRNGNFVMIRLT